MNVILYFRSPTSNKASTEALVGAREIAGRLSWLVRDFDGYMAPNRIRELLDFWKPIGVIVECGEWPAPFDISVFRMVQTVYVDLDPKQIPKNSFSIAHDSVEAGQMAARELLSTGYQNFAFVPFPGNWWWNGERHVGFSNALSLNGFGCSVFHAGSVRPHSPEYSQRLRKFISGLPKPCAIFAANDCTAADVLSEAAALQLTCPKDIAIVGVDDVESICEHTRPRLTSIRPDFSRAGELAALTIIALHRSRRRFRGDHYRRYGSSGVIRRESTQVQRVATDRESLLAMNLIRNRACHGLTAGEVLNVYHCSRAMAARKFKAATGNTILQEIHAVQLARVKNLLAHSRQQLETISSFCGFTNPNSLRKFFLRETGMTMSDWRKKHLPALAKGRR